MSKFCCGISLLVLEADKPATANQAFSLVRRVFNAMMPEKANPCTGVVKFSEQSRDRFLYLAGKWRY